LDGVGSHLSFTIPALQAETRFPDQRQSSRAATSSESFRFEHEKGCVTTIVIVGGTSAGRPFWVMVKVEMPKTPRYHSGLNELPEGEPKRGRVKKKTRKPKKKR